MAAKRQALTKKTSNKRLRDIARAIPGHLAPLIPGLESFQSYETGNMTDDLTTRPPGLEPHYDIEHFVPEDELGYRGVSGDPQIPHGLGDSTVCPQQPDLQQCEARLQTAVLPDRAAPTPPHNNNQQASVSASYVDASRHPELKRNHTKQYQSIADCMPLLMYHELEAPTTKTFPVKTRVPNIILTPSSPIRTGTASRYDVFENSLLIPPPMCYKKKERRRQEEVDQGRMVELVRRRSLRSFSQVESPNRVQVAVKPVRNYGNPSNVDVPRRARRQVEPVVSSFEKYAYRLFG